jgi:hypothetical protein
MSGAGTQPYSSISPALAPETEVEPERPAPIEWLKEEEDEDDDEEEEE